MKASSWYATKRLLCLDIKIMLTNNEKQRYQKHLLLAKIGVEGQEKLKAASVLVVVFQLNTNSFAIAEYRSNLPFLKSFIVLTLTEVAINAPIFGSL